MSLRSMVVAVLCVVWTAATAFSQAPVPTARQDRILVKFKPGSAPAGDLRPHGTVIRRFEALSIEVIRLDGTATVAQALAEYRADSRVAYAQPDHIRSKQLVPNDPAPTESEPWQLENDGWDLGKLHADIAARAAWDIRHDAPEVVVAVLDTGIRYTHEDLAANMWRNEAEANGIEGVDDDGDGIVDDIYGANLINNTGVPMDDEGHGTFIAGLIGAAGNNAKGVTGVCWKVQLMAVKVLDSHGSGTDSDIIAGMEYARTHGAKIINASLGRGGSENPAIEDAVAQLDYDGVVLVAAAGNDSRDNDFDLNISTYPGSSARGNVVTVAASTRNDLLATFSNYGWRSVDLAAPGVEVPSTSSESDSSYDVESGTSISAPLVTGALALVTAQFPNETAQQHVARLLNSVDPIARLAGKCTTGGRLNVARALSGGSAAPVNDAFARAIPLGNDIRFAGTGVNAAAGVEADEPGGTFSNPPRRTLWFSWSAPYIGQVNISALTERGSSFANPAAVNVYQGTGKIGTLMRVGTNAPGGPGTASPQFSFQAQYHQTYYISVESGQSSGGPVGFAGIYDLAPDGFGPYTILSVGTSGPGSIAPAKLLGETLQFAGQTVTLRSAPARGYILYAWIDPTIDDLEQSILSRNPVYTFSMPQVGIKPVEAVFAPNPFVDLKGHYNGLATASDPSLGAAFLSLDLNSSGGFTGSVKLGPATYRFKSVFRSDRQYSATFTDANGAPVTVSFKLNRERRITGTVHSAAGDFDIVAEAGDFSFLNNPNLSAGTYTVLLPPVSPTAGQPGGSGFGVLTVSGAGNARFSGLLGDGRRVTLGSTLFRTGHWPFFATPYKKGGSLSGLVTFDENAPDSDATGALTWNKSAFATDATYPAGFSAVAVGLTASRYTPPVSGEKIIALSSSADNAELSVGGENLPRFTISLTVDGQNRVSGGPNVNMVFFVGSGEFAANIVNNGSVLKSHGMVSRKADRGRGYVITGKTTADVLFEPVH